MKEVVRRVGQRFMVGFEGTGASTDVKHLVRDFGVGHVILFARNVDRPEQVAELVRELQEVARDAGHDRPLLVAVDQEGGRVARLREPWTIWPPLRSLGQVGDEETARRMGRALAHELHACGIRCDFAPVMDVDTNPKNPVIGDRSFGDDPDLVGRLGAAMIDGLQRGRVAACAKHFPGHGDTDVDSHLDLPAVDHSRARLEDVELRPFRKAIEAGVATIMTAHVLVRDLDDRLPATLSPRLDRRAAAQGDEVRGRRGVRRPGDEGAWSKHWPAGQAAVLAAQAGCDILPVCKSPDAQVEAIEALIRAVEREDIKTSALDDADARIRAMKDRFLLPYRDPDPKEARRVAGLGEHRSLAAEIGSRSGLPARA